MEWYLLKDGGAVYGPVPVGVLRQWAADGRVAPEDSVSGDQKTWIAAPNLADLEMDWMVELDGGALYGPLHVQSARALAADGAVPAHARIIHKKTGEARPLAEPPAPAAPAPTRVPVPEAAPRAAARPAEPRAEWREIAESKDQFEKEARKWKKMYDDERESGLKKEAALNERVEELRKSELAVRMKLEQVERKLSHVENSYKLLRQVTETGDPESRMAQLSAIMESSQELTERYDSLVQQLTAKNTEIQSLLESRAQAEKAAGEQIKQMEQVAQREREEADLARKRAAELEEAHLQLVKTYRDLNERFIRLRETQGAPAPAPAPAPAEPAPGSKAKTRRFFSA